MRSVTKQEFYDKIGPMDVIPSIDSSWSDAMGYTTIWKTRQRSDIGMTRGLMSKKEYYLYEGPNGQ